MAEVFKTNVAHHHEGHELKSMLQEHFPEARINFDLQDCDRILRVEGQDILPDKIIDLLQSRNYFCEALE